MRSASELRVEKLLQSTNIKLSSVASAVFGVSGRLMLQSLAKGMTDPVKLAALAKGTLRNKRAELTRALRGTFTADDARLLAVELNVIDDLEKRLAKLDQLIDSQAASFASEIVLLDTIPGVDRTLATDLIAEIGSDMTAWPSHGHFAAWTGTCPGNRESAGVRRRARTREGNPYVKVILLRAAVCASRTVTSYLASRYRRLAARRGPQRAIVALGHQIAIAIYHMLKNHQPYIAPKAADPALARRNKSNQLIRELKKLGFEVTCTPANLI
jgi:transposase